MENPLFSISDTLKDLETENDHRDLALQALSEKVIDVDKRLSNLETARSSDLARIEAALSQVAAERKGMAVDFERYMNRIENSPQPPQLPPAQPTDN